MPLCNRMFCCIFGWYFYIEIRLKYEKIILSSSSRAFDCLSYGKQCCLSALELFHCLPLWKTVRLYGKKLQNATKYYFLVSKKRYPKAELLSHFTSRDLPDSEGKVSTKANSAVTPKRLLPQESQSRPIAIKKLIWWIPTLKSNSLKKRNISICYKL